MTEQFDISALEKALSPKSRKPRQELSIKPSLSMRELYNEAKGLADECRSVYGRKLRTRYQGDSYYIYYRNLYINDRRVDDFEQVPRAVLEKLIVNGRCHLKNYHDMVNTVITQNPEIALEASLEGKTGDEILKFAFDKRRGQIGQLFEERISSPVANIYLEFDVIIKPSLGQQFNISVTWRSNRSNVGISGIEPYSMKEVDITKLVHFITYFEQVVEQVHEQLDKIEIKKEVEG